MAGLGTDGAPGAKVVAGDVVTPGGTGGWGMLGATVVGVALGAVGTTSCCVA